MQNTLREQNANFVNDLKKEFITFIQTFQENGRHKYLFLAQSMINNNRHTMVISFHDFMRFSPDMAQLVFTEYYKYEPTLNEALTTFMLEFDKHHEGHDENQDLKEKFEVAFDKGLTEADHSVRDLKCGLLGQLRSFKGTVTRTSEVRPELISGVFHCKNCGQQSPSIVQQFKYTEPKKCRSQNCDMANWELDLAKSQFADFQKIRVQEDPTKIPPGAMPRSIDVILRNDNTEKGQPGDICDIIGYLCVLPELSSMLKPGERTQMMTRSNQTRGSPQEMEGIRGIKGIRDLNYKLAFIATNLKVENNQFNELNEEQEDDSDNYTQKSNEKEQFNEANIFAKICSRLSQPQLEEITRLKENKRLYDQAADSLFASIFGHIEIKKALLLQLLGGIHKKTQNKINIRGDINILIVGDPASAKSQFLKCVNNFVPRSVYTNGKTTSAAGLTASVTRDENGNVGIEAGALMLADNGICCIDEFDKMEIKDQVAIHEAMEQQTISIAKAGVYATLNARTSILAAANPLFGRYDKSKSLKNNINLSAPIMSRFDLFFVVCDESNNETDMHLAEFMINMHRRQEQALVRKYDPKTLKLYFSVAKKIKPMLTLDASDLLRKYYLELRSRDKANGNNSYRVTVRQLQSMIRLSEAYARLHLQFYVRPFHVKEAYRLLTCSILKLEKSDIVLNEEEEYVQDRIGDLEIDSNKLLSAELRRKEIQKKIKKVSITNELYLELQKNIFTLFKEKQRKHENNEIDNQKQVTQDELCSYLLSLTFQSGLVSTMEETEQMKKIVNAVIRKMLKEERMLTIIEDSLDPAQRILALHPNYED